MYLHRLQCIRNGIKKVTLASYELKVTLKKSFCIAKRKIITVGLSFLIDRHFVFFSGLRTFFLNDCLLVGKKKPPSCTHLLNMNLFDLEKEDTKLISHNSSFPSPCVNWTPISLSLSLSLCVTPHGAIRANRESPVQFTYGVGKNLSTYEPGLAVRVDIYKVEWKGTRANYRLLKFA